MSAPLLQGPRSATAAQLEHTRQDQAKKTRAMGAEHIRIEGSNVHLVFTKEIDLNVSTVMFCLLPEKYC